MGITIKSANPDDIWESWKRKASKTQKLEKHYGTKGAVFNLDQVTATEFVKNVSKAAIIYFEKRIPIDIVKFEKEKNQFGKEILERKKLLNFNLYIKDLQQKAKLEDFISKQLKK